MAHAQLCFHGHRDAVKFFTAVPGMTRESPVTFSMMMFYRTLIVCFSCWSSLLLEKDNMELSSRRSWVSFCCLFMYWRILAFCLQSVFCCPYRRPCCPICWSRRRGRRWQANSRLAHTRVLEISPSYEWWRRLHWLQNGSVSYTLSDVIRCTSAGTFLTLFSYHICLPISGDEGGEGEDLSEPALKLQPFLAKAERSHLIVWQVMVNGDWAPMLLLSASQARTFHNRGFALLCLCSYFFLILCLQLKGLCYCVQLSGICSQVFAHSLSWQYESQSCAHLNRWIHPSI